eukprot:363223-Chlamydomonas_euryale.AAC.9
MSRSGQEAWAGTWTTAALSVQQRYGHKPDTAVQPRMHACTHACTHASMHMHLHMHMYMCMLVHDGSARTNHMCLLHHACLHTEPGTCKHESMHTRPHTSVPACRQQLHTTMHGRPAQKGV